MSQETDVQELIRRIEIMEHRLGLYYYIPRADAALEELIEHLDNLTLQQVLREIEAKDLVLAMIGFQPKTLALIKTAMSHNAWEMIKDDMACQVKWGFAGDLDKH